MFILSLTRSFEYSKRETGAPRGNPHRTPQGKAPNAGSDATEVTSVFFSPVTRDTYEREDAVITMEGRDPSAILCVFHSRGRRKDRAGAGRDPSRDEAVFFQPTFVQPIVPGSVTRPLAPALCNRLYSDTDRSSSISDSSSEGEKSHRLRFPAGSFMPHSFRPSGLSRFFVSLPVLCCN